MPRGDRAHRGHDPPVPRHARLRRRRRRVAARRRAAVARARARRWPRPNAAPPAWWPSGCRASSDAADAYRGGLVLTDVRDSIDTRRPAAGNSSARITAWPSAPCSALPWKRASNSLPSPFGRGAGGEGRDEGDPPPTVTLALASADGVRQKAVPGGIHPELLHIYIAKHAFNFVRLALLGA